MTKRARSAAFGSAGALVVAGAVCGALISGAAGQVLAMALIGLGLIGATSLVFLEIGLGEDRARDRDRAREQKRRLGTPAAARRRLKPPKLERSRGRRRRLE
ncbi:MAG: hypothetical protein ACR2L9_10245 [Solirubrobacteraceae bacterium]